MLADVECIYQCVDRPLVEIPQDSNQLLIRACFSAHGILTSAFQGFFLAYFWH